MKNAVLVAVVFVSAAVAERSSADFIDVQVDTVGGVCQVVLVYPAAYGMAGPGDVMWKVTSSCTGAHDVQMISAPSKCPGCKALPTLCEEDLPMLFTGPGENAKTCHFPPGSSEGYGYKIEVCSDLICRSTDPEIWINETLTPKTKLRALRQVITSVRKPNVRKRTIKEKKRIYERRPKSQ